MIRPATRLSRAVRRRLARRPLRPAKRFILAGSILGVFGLGAALHGAVTLSWDPTLSGTATAGGSGTWDTGTGNWFNATATADQNWINDGTAVASFDGSSGTVTLSGALNAAAVSFNTSAYTLAGPGTLTLAGGATSGLAFPSISVVSANGDTISAVLAGTNGVHVTGGGKLILAGANTLTGGFSIDAALGQNTVLRAGALGALGAGSNVVTFGGAGTGDLQLGGFSQVIGGLSGAGTVENAGGSPATLTITSTGDQTFSGLIQDGGSGALSLVINGTGGTQSITGSTNTYTGGTTISSGAALTIAADASLGATAGAVTLTGGGTLNFNYTSTTATARVFNFATGGGALNLAAGSGTAGKILLGAGQLAGSGALTKLGAGDLQLTGANTAFSGNVFINGGYIEMSNSNGLGTSGLITINSGGELVGNGQTLSYPLALTGTGILSANNNTTFLGNITVPASGAFTIAPRFFQTPASGSSMTLAGNITGAATANFILPTSSATVIFAGDNTNWTGLGTSFPAVSSTFNLSFGPKGRPGAASGVAVTLNGGSFGVLSDGDGTGAPNVAGTFTDTLNVAASSTITVGRVGLGTPIGSNLFTTPSNKTIVESGDLQLNAVTLTVANNNGYGLNLSGGVSLNATAPTLKANTASYSSAPAGLTLSGLVSSGSQAPTTMARISSPSPAAMSP